MKESAVRTKILEAASRLFYTQGYNLTGINQIIEEAGIARASLYYHFDTKTDLLIAYLKEAEEQWFAAMVNFLAPFTDPREKLLALFDYRMDRQIKSNFGGCQFIKIGMEVSPENHQVFELVRQQKDHLKSHILSIAEQINNKNQILNPVLLTEALFLLMEGATTNGAINKSPDSMKNAKMIAEKLF